jgi:hypothetical protein
MTLINVLLQSNEKFNPITNIHEHYLKKQVEKLSRGDEQSAFLTGGVSNFAKFTFSFRRAKKYFLIFFKFWGQSGFFTPPALYHPHTPT